jgi:hypothetical protein
MMGMSIDQCSEVHTDQELPLQGLKWLVPPGIKCSSLRDGSGTVSCEPGHLKRPLLV